MDFTLNICNFVEGKAALSFTQPQYRFQESYSVDVRHFKLLLVRQIKLDS